MKLSWLLSLLLLVGLTAGSYIGFLALRLSALAEGIVYDNGQTEGSAVRVAATMATFRSRIG